MFVRFLTFLPVMLMATAGSAIGGGAGTGAGAGSGSSQGSGSGSSTGTGQSSSVTPGVDTGQGSGSGQSSPAGQGQGQGQQQSDPNANDPAYGNWKALRDQNHQYRTQAEQAAAQLATWNQVSTNAASLAKELGFEDADFQAAFAQDPMKTIAILQQTQAERQAQQGNQGRQGQQRQDGQQPDIEDLISRRVTDATKPVTEFVNNQMTEAAMVKYETNLTESITADPILKSAPTEVQDIVKDYLGEYFASQPQILLGFKQKGDFAPVKEAVTYIAGRLQTAFTAWLNANNSTGGFRGRGQQQQGQGQGQIQQRGNGKLTLDAIIDDPSVLGDQYRG